MPIVQPEDQAQPTEPATPTWKPPARLAEFRKRRESLIKELEQQSDLGSINVDEMVERYAREYDRPVFTLAQEIQIQAALYYNVFEELKRNSSPNNTNIAQDLKVRYAKIGLIFEDNQWPNPASDWLMNKALSKMRVYVDAMRTLIGRWQQRLIAELNFGANVAIGFQMTISLPPAFSISIQPELAIAAR